MRTETGVGGRGSGGEGGRTGVLRGPARESARVRSLRLLRSGRNDTPPAGPPPKPPPSPLGSRRRQTGPFRGRAPPPRNGAPPPSPSPKLAPPLRPPRLRAARRESLGQPVMPLPARGSGTKNRSSSSRCWANRPLVAAFLALGAFIRVVSSGHPHGRSPIRQVVHPHRPCRPPADRAARMPNKDRDVFRPSATPGPGEARFAPWHRQRRRGAPEKRGKRRPARTGSTR